MTIKSLQGKTGAQLVALWNSLPGVTKVKKFTSNSVAIKRILAAKPAEKKVPASARETKKDLALAMVVEGTTIDALMNATGWQRHTVRGFLSIQRKNGFAIAHATRAEGVTSYATA